MVSAVVAPPVVKSVAATVAVQVAAARARLSVTVMVPRPALVVPPGAVAPRSAAAGTVIDRVPLNTKILTLQAGSALAGGQLFPGAVEVMMLSRSRSPVAGSLTVTE